MPWQGNNLNRQPNEVHEPINRAEKEINANRSTQVRRDTDNQKDFTISLYDIDKTVLDHLESLQLSIEDKGQLIKVPAFFGAQEKWKSVQNDGYVRDSNGKIMLPLIMLKRTSSDPDDSLKFLNRYLSGAVRRTYSEKNKYTKFSALVGQNAPVNEIYNVSLPSHMLLRYHFGIWTDSIQSMNVLVEKLRYNTNDYWGTPHGLKFRVTVESFNHTVEVNAGQDRLLRTEFDLNVHGYILPETMNKLGKNISTFQKQFSPKKIIIGAEVVASDYDFNKLSNNSEKWRNQKYPNLPKDQVLPTVPTTVVDSIKDSSISGEVFKSLNSISNIYPEKNNLVHSLMPTSLPTSISTRIGKEGEVAQDDNYFYVFTSGEWKRVAMIRVVAPPTNPTQSYGQEGCVSFDSQYFYIYSNNSWKRVAISQFENVA